MKISAEQWATLANPVCSFCKEPMVYAPETEGAAHADPTEAAVCGILSAGLPRTVLVDDTAEAQAVKAAGSY